MDFSFNINTLLNRLNKINPYSLYIYIYSFFSI
nr:MAG TPA: hypothetical protein [Caudoviricetes sp.]